MGAQISVDIVFNVKLVLTDIKDRSSKSVFTLSPDCSHGAIKAIKVDVETLAIEASVPQQGASK